MAADSSSKAAVSWAGRLLLAIAALTAVAILWSRRPQPPAPVEFRLGPGVRAPAPRPPPRLYLNLGTPSARSALVQGFGENAAIQGRSVVHLAADRAILRLSTMPDAAGMVLRTLGRSPLSAGQRVKVRVNGNDAGALELGSEWTWGSVALPPHLLYAGANELELISSPGGVALDALSVTPASGALELDLGTTTSRSALISGWLLRATPEGGLRAALTQATARAKVSLRPTPDDYVLGLAGHAGPSESGPGRVQVFVNGAAVGAVSFGAVPTGAAMVTVRSRLQPGNNRLDFTRVSGPEVTLDLLRLEPITEVRWIDVGSASDRVFLAAGFSADEKCQGGSCAWSDGATSDIRFFVHPPSATDYRLSIRAHSFDAIAPVQIGAELNGKSLGTLTIPAELTVNELMVPRAALISGENRVVLSYGRTAQPRATMKGSEDARVLAVRYDWLELAPAN